MARGSLVNSESDLLIAAKRKMGVYMFIAYAIIYAGFVVINIWKPLLMEKIIFSGLNLAVIYGFGLIIIALILALIYNHLCQKKEKEFSMNSEEKGEE